MTADSQNMVAEMNVFYYGFMKSILENRKADLENAYLRVSLSSGFRTSTLTAWDKFKFKILLSYLRTSSGLF